MEGADLVAVVLGKPDGAFGVDGDIPRARASSWDGPLLEVGGIGIEHGNRVGHGHGEPEIAALVKGQKERLPEVSRELIGLHEGLRLRIEDRDLAGWRTRWTGG